MKLPWLPPGSAPPSLQTSALLCRPLKLSDVVKDYDAVMASRTDIQFVFGPDVDWPAADLSIEQDMVDLGWHQKEWELSLSYTYTVMSLDGNTCLGCVYVMPPEKAGFDAQVIYWARSGQPAPAGEASLTAHLGAALEAWLSSRSGAWPFKRVAWPGRKIPWAEWAAMPAPGGA